MNRRIFNLMLPLLPAALLAKPRGVTVTLTGLDPRFVEQLKVAAVSRQTTLEGYIVLAAVLLSGYHLNNGFAGDK